ncbi:SDR family NAD(P)-dependent oxidoreductase [Alphaproteobacteria bacterium]|nr:SDR family NAD(P)-dependent oxidoreductase [Alphaproteobacteria bacterium]
MRGKNVWIVGANGILGRHLVSVLAPHNRLAISGSDQAALKKIAKECEPWEPISVHPLNLAKQKDIEDTVKKVAEAWPQIDVVLFLSPCVTEEAIGKTTGSQFDKALTEHVSHAYHLAKAVETPFMAQQFGTLAFVAGATGYRAYPGATACDLAKSGLHYMAEALYMAWKSKGIRVQVINPGFMKTATMGARTMNFPFLVSPEASAQMIINGLEKHCLEIHFPKILTYALKIISLTPSWLYARLAFLWDQMRK